MKILWIDPLNTNPQFLNLMAIILQEAGHQVLVRANSRQAFLPPTDVQWLPFSRMPVVPTRLKDNFSASVRLCATYPLDWLAAARHARQLGARSLLISSNLMLSRLDTWGLGLLRRRGIDPVVLVHKPYQAIASDQGQRQAPRYRAFYRKAVRILTMNQYTQNLMQTLYDIPSDRIGRFRHPHFQPLLDRYEVDEDLARRLASWAGDAPVLAFLSNMRPEQGLDDLLAALSSLRKSVPDWRLLLISPGDRRDEIETRLASEGLSQRCWCHWERYSYAQLRAFLRTASLVVTPYRWSAQSGVAAMAAAAGLPVVTTDVGGLPEMVHQGVNGELVPPNDPESLAHAITQVATNLEHYRPGVEAWRRGGCDPQQATEAIVQALNASS